MADVSLRGIVKHFGDVAVLKGIDLDVRDGELLTLIGASGCGKSTLLRILAGLEAQTAGTVAIGGRTVDHLRPRHRRIAMVFQSYALYPHMTVAENIATPLLMDRTYLAERLPLTRYLSPRRRRVAQELQAEVSRVAETLRIDHLLARRPAELSGGQRQRVALGRAMVREPHVFLMDEPLSNLDATLRVHMRKELADLQKRLGGTFVYVTHDQVEAMTMSDRVALMDGGELLQVAAPHDLYHRPSSIAVARFLGSPRINVFHAEVTEGSVCIDGVRLARALGADRRVLVAVRPENLTLTDAPRGALSTELLSVEDLGHEAILHARHHAADGDPPEVRVRLTAAELAEARANGALGERVEVSPAPGSLLLFETDGRRAPDPVDAPGDRSAAPPHARAVAG